MRGSQSSLPPPWWRGGERAGLLLAGDCVVLRRVAEGGVEQVAGGYIDRDQPIPGDLGAVLDELLSEGLVTVADDDPPRGRLVLTEAGSACHAVLCQASAVPSQVRITELAGAIRRGDLSAAQNQGLARLVEQTGTAVRVVSGLTARHRDPVWVPVTVVFHELVVLSR